MPSLIPLPSPKSPTRSLLRQVGETQAHADRTTQVIHQIRAEINHMVQNIHDEIRRRRIHNQNIPPRAAPQGNLASLHSARRMHLPPPTNGCNNCGSVNCVRNTNARQRTLRSAIEHLRRVRDRRPATNRRGRRHASSSPPTPLAAPRPPFVAAAPLPSTLGLNRRSSLPTGTALEEVIVRTTHTGAQEMMWGEFVLPDGTRAICLAYRS